MEFLNAVAVVHALWHGYFLPAPLSPASSVPRHSNRRSPLFKRFSGLWDWS